MTNQRTGGRILVDQLVAQGCDRVFTVPGESFLAVLDALHDTPAIDLVTCRQEGGVAFMACADGTLTHRPGIAFVTRGPGATNASIGVHVAMQDSQPMILFIGDVDRGTKDREAFQEIDFPAMFTPIAKWAARIDDARRIPEYVARAYATAMNGRPGPVVLALPEDMLCECVEAVDRPRVERVVQAPDTEVMHRLALLLRAAERPLAIIGGAGWNDRASHWFEAFATRWKLPVIAAFRRQDAISNESSVWAGNLGYGPNPKLVSRIRDADVLLVVGPRLGEATTDGYTLVEPGAPGQTLIHVHPDPDELGRTYRIDLSICADLAEFALVADAIASDTLKATHLPGEGRGPGWPAQEERVADHGRGDESTEPQSASGPTFQADEAHTDYLAWSTPAAREDVTMDLGPCVLAMREALPADTIICNGAGNFSAWWHRYWRYAGPGCQLAPTAGAMGYGVPAAVAAKLRHPERTVVAVAGDGDFLMNAQELATAVQHGADILVILVDNGAYGTIRMHQEREYPGRVAATRLTNPDFAALARAYGCWAETVERTADFAPALTAAMAQGGVRLLHCKTDVEAITPAATLSALRKA